MILPQLFLFLILLCRYVRATALTTAIAANERLCFYADVDKAGEKIGVSIAVTISS
jgi:protein ERP2